MKKMCYPKYSYIIFYCLSLVSIVFAVLPFFIATDEIIWFRLIWSCSMCLLSLALLLGGLSFTQIYNIVENKIIVSNPFGKVAEIDLNYAVYEIKNLDTYFSWVVSVPIKWICIYENKQLFERFNMGCSNKKNKKRLQIIFSDYLLSELKNRNLKDISDKFLVSK